jgi:prepilin-type N-terminal cleavage/methylation domain-containing protein/prepilin-type processing-associated H-X9-DG protein
VFATPSCPRLECVVRVRDPGRQSGAPAHGLMSSLSRSPQAASRGFTLVELLVVIAIIGVLVSLLLPAVQASRESARRTGCLNNLRQMGIGLQSYRTRFGCFPPGGVEPRPLWHGGRQLAWSVFLLPYVEQEPLYDQLDTDKPFDAPENADAAARVLPIYVCPSVPDGDQLKSGRGPSQYGGIFGERITGPNDPPKGVMLYDRSITVAEIRDGTSQTLVISEDSNFKDGQWINARNVFDQAFAINQAPAFENDIRSRHPGGANGLFCDGSTRFLVETLDLSTLAAICTRAGGEVVVDF